MQPKRVLFLCTGNSCRSQMAEGWLRHLGGSQFTAQSAGAKPAGFVHPLAIAAMQEAGINIGNQTSKHIGEFLPPSTETPDLIISVCSNAESECPIFPSQTQRWHWPFDDPAHATGSDEQKMSEFRRVRDEIRSRIERELLPTAS